MAPPTLKSMAQRNLIRNLSHLQDVGDAPYDVVKPALRKIVDPQQLRTIETASPHICDSDSELWIAFIKRDIPNWKDKMVTPKNPRSWWKVYRKLWREEKAAQEEQSKQLKEALMGKEKEKEEQQTNILNTVVQQRFRQKAMVDGNVNSKAGSYGFERAGTVANAKRSGKNIISAIRKASTKPSQIRASMENAKQAGQQRMWQTPDPQPGVRKNTPPNLMRGPPNMIQKTAESALARAKREGERLKQEKVLRASNSPPPSAAPSAHSPPKAAPTATSPPPKASQSAAGSSMTPLGPGAGSKRSRNQETASPAPPQKRQRAPVSIFMPKRAKR